MSQRDQTWALLNQHWDVIIVGGGITGAGILREAARAGLKVLLLEARDFASGTSSRSSKMVHGGLRYLQNAQIKLTFESVRERERLMKEGRGLINPLGFVLPNYRGDKIPGWIFGTGLLIYDILGLKWAHRHYGRDGILQLSPQIRTEKLLGGYRFFDAIADDARLVMRVIREARMAGGQALNYAFVGSLLKDRRGRVCGVTLTDLAPEGKGRNVEVQASVVINATGAWADELRQQVGARPRMRQLRGSHLLFSAHKLPLKRAVSFLHPVDHRPVMALPWESVTLFGTTDLDHKHDLANEPAISLQEIDYLLTGLSYMFPDAGLSERDVLSTFAGVRGVVDTGKTNPSKESREHVAWREKGLLTITGGKLTTFRVMANTALRAIRSVLPDRLHLHTRHRVLSKPPQEISGLEELSPSERTRLIGRYGVDSLELAAGLQAGDLDLVAGTNVHVGELRWAARNEDVVHLEDLLLRRARVGLLAQRGGLDEIDRIRQWVQEPLGWSDERWQSEVIAFERLWNCCYSMPGMENGPD